MQDEAQIVEGFWRAAYGDIPWEAAIDAIAGPLDCRTGQVAVIDREAGVVASVLSRVSADEMRDLIRYGTSDPATNPRIPAMLRATPGVAITDDDMLPAAVRRAMPIYRDWFIPTGSCAASIVRSSAHGDAPCITFALLGREGGATTDVPVRRLLERLFPAITDATRLAVRFGRMQADAMAVALDDHRHLCIALRQDMVPTALSPGAEPVLSGGQYLGLRHGRVYACHRDADRDLRNLVGRIAAGDPAAMRRNRIVLRPATAALPAIIALLTPVPDRAGLSETCALLTLPDQAAPDDMAGLLANVFRLTSTEAAIAIAIAAGRNPAQIAAERGQSRETVRTHVRSILMKTGTHRESELAALIGRLGN